MGVREAVAVKDQHSDAIGAYPLVQGLRAVGGRDLGRCEREGTHDPVIHGATQDHPDGVGRFVLRGVHFFRLR